MKSHFKRFILYILLYFVLKELLDWLPFVLRDIVLMLFCIGYFIWVIVDIYKVITQKKNSKIVQIIIADVISLATFCILIYLTIERSDITINIITLMTVSYLLLIISIVKRTIL